MNAAPTAAAAAPVAAADADAELSLPPTPTSSSSARNSVNDTDVDNMMVSVEMRAHVVPQRADVIATTATAPCSDGISKHATPALLEALEHQKAALANAAKGIVPCQWCSASGKHAPADQRCCEPRCRIHMLCVCSSCSDRVHRTDDERKHRQSVLSNCPQCELERATFYCSECDLAFCAPCFSTIHAPKRVRGHIKVALEGATCALLSRANASKKFQSTMNEMMAAGADARAATKQSPTQGAVVSVPRPSAAVRDNAPIDVDAVGAKRKREEVNNIDIILVDSDDGDESDKVMASTLSVPSRAPAATVVAESLRPPRSLAPSQQQQNITTTTGSSSRHSFPQSLPTSAASGPVQHKRSLSATATMRANGSSVFTHVQGQQQQSQQVPAADTMAIQPFQRGGPPRPVGRMQVGIQDLGLRRVVSSDAYDTDSSSFVTTSSSTNGMSDQTSSVVIEPMSAPMPYTAPPGGLPVQPQSDGWDSVNGSSMPLPMSGRQSVYTTNGFPIDTSAGGTGSLDMPLMAPPMPSPSPPPTTTLSVTNTHVATTSDWTANPLEDVLYDRYYQMNLYTVKLEQTVSQMNARIVHVSAQNLSMAQQMAATLRQQQNVLQTAQVNRLNTLIALVVEASGIMTKVKRLRMDTLSDIAAVVTASHRRCIELSEDIALLASNATTLHQQMAYTLEAAAAMDPDAFHQTVLTINQSLQLNEQTARSKREERENEIVRIVQYSSDAREGLKRAFHQQRRSASATSTPVSAVPPPQQQQQWPHQQPPYHSNNGHHR